MCWSPHAAHHDLCYLRELLERQVPASEQVPCSPAQGVPPVTRTFNTLMIACNTSGQWQQALEVHREMRADGHALNTTSYNALISAHSKSGHLDQVLSTYRSMVEEVRPPHLDGFPVPHHRCLHSGQTMPADA